MRIPHSLTLAFMATSVFLAGCATAPPPPPGRIPVVYSTESPGGSKLKEKPTEVTVVSRASTQKEVGKQVALNIALAVIGGGFAARTFSKDDLKGSPIDIPGDRANVRNPVPEDFVKRLDQQINAVIKADPALSQMSWKEPINVSDGYASLVYDTLGGNDTEKLSLVLQLNINKYRETTGRLNFAKPPFEVNCSSSSEPPLPLAAWTANNAIRVKTELDKMLDQCSGKVMAALPQMLKY
ncbi:hypothetical protein [Amphibiibacter pelophylacis]|uniref:Uncharacterized protein n=1 Tax=Amphibiibacter pelophylacis TaxID=1799477 RepID=A0ACC6P0S3_9BURK